MRSWFLLGAAAASRTALRVVRQHAGLASLFAAGVAVAVLPEPAVAARVWDEIAEMFRQTRYDAAQARLIALSADALRSPEGIFWQVQLATDPAAALSAIGGAVSNNLVSAELRARLALEAARIEDARGRSAEAIAWAEKAHDDRRLGAQATALIAAARRTPARGRGSAGPATLGDPAHDESVVAGAGTIWLQLGAYTDRKRADQFQQQWRQKLPALRVVAEDGPGGARFWKVREGPFRTREEAAVRAASLKRSHGLDTILVEAGR